MLCIIKNESKEVRFFYYGMLVTLATYIIMNMWSNNVIFADGVYYFSNIVETKNFYIIEPGTEIFEMLRQLFCVVGIKVGINNIKVLSYLYSFGCMYLQVVFTILSMNLCINNKKYSYFFLTALCIVLQIIFTGFFVMMGYISYSMLIFYAFLYLTFSNNETSKISKICFTIYSGMFFLRATSIFLFLGTLMIILILYKLITKKVRIEMFYVLNIIIYITGCFSALTTIINPRDPSNKGGYVNTILNFDKLVYIIFFLLFISMLFSVIMVIFDRKNNKTSCTCFKALSIMFQLISGILLLYYVYNSSYLISINSYSFRSLNLIISFAVLFYILFVEIFNIHLTSTFYKYCTILFLAAALLFICVSTINYNYHLKYLNDRLSNNIGYVEISEIGALEHSYFWGWTNSLESLYAQILSDRLTIKSIIVNDENYLGWEPFDGRNIDAYPDLSFYGVNYNKKFEEN